MKELTYQRLLDLLDEEENIEEEEKVEPILDNKVIKDAINNRVKI